MKKSSFDWARKGKGYEVSSKGDSRFSAFRARLPGHGNRTIEEIYQCDPIVVKGYDPGGVNWRLGKGRPAKDPNTTHLDLWKGYLSLWWEWTFENMELIEELAQLAADNGHLLTDMFASSTINQARALSVILSELYPEG